MNKTNNFLMVGILLLAVMVPLTTWLAVSNQENRSSAASDSSVEVSQSGEVVDGVCGSANGTTVSSLPSVWDACAQGAVNWMDRDGSDGTYNWYCYGSVGKVNVSCSAKTSVDGVVCATDVKQCPDGSYVSRVGSNCEFAECE